MTTHHLWAGSPTLTPAQVADLRAQRQQGMPIKTLMQTYGLSKATVYRYLDGTTITEG